MEKRNGTRSVGRLSKFCLLMLVGSVMFGCSSSNTTTGGTGQIVVPLVGWWHGSWSQQTSLTDVINDTEDVTTEFNPVDGVARLEITATISSSQTITGNLLMTGFACFNAATVTGSWSGSNLGFNAIDATTPAEMGSRIASISVANGGSGYTQSTTIVTLSAPDLSSGTQATATATVDNTGVITGFVITNAGSGYNLAPGVTISDGGGGVGAVGTAVLEESAETTKLSLSGHQSADGTIRLEYAVSAGSCTAKRGDLLLTKSG